jgi:glutamyl-tRNA synthetase
LLQPLHISCSEEKARLIVEAMRERITFPSDLWTDAKFYHHAPENFEMQVVQKKWTPAIHEFLIGYAKSLAQLASITKEDAQLLLDKICTEIKCKPGQVLQLLRLALTGGSSGPDLMLSVQILGATESANRISAAAEMFRGYMANLNEKA